MSAENLQSPSSIDESQIQSSWTTTLFTGIMMIILGVLAIALPVAATLTVKLLIAFLLIAGGIIQLIATFSKGCSHRIFTFLSALLFGIVGILLLANPWEGLMAMTLVLSIFFIVEGIMKIITAFQIRPGNQWGWMLFSGVITLLLGGIIWAGLPYNSLWVIGLIFGIDLLFGGLATIMIAFAIRDMTKASASVSTGRSKPEPSGE